MIIVTSYQEWLKEKNANPSKYIFFCSPFIKEYLDKYPTLFASEDHLISLDCPPEWADVVIEALDQLRDLPIRIVQIKEKLNGLRIYWECSFHFDSPEYSEIAALVFPIILEAEQKASKIPFEKYNF